MIHLQHGKSENPNRNQSLSGEVSTVLVVNIQVQTYATLEKKCHELVEIHRESYTAIS